MNGANALMAAFVAVVVAAITGLITARTSRKTTAMQTDVSLSAEARQWVSQAQDDAREAKEDAAAARRESSEAVRRADAAERTLDQASADFDRRQRELIEQTDVLMRWIGRVVRESHTPALANIDHPAVRHLLETINGGPPGLTTDRLRVPPKA